MEYKKKKVSISEFQAGKPPSQVNILQAQPLLENLQMYKNDISALSFVVIAK